MRFVRAFVCAVLLVGACVSCAGSAFPCRLEFGGAVGGTVGAVDLEHLAACAQPSDCTWSADCRVVCGGVAR